MLNRGDIYWVNLDPTTGSEIKKKRPCVLIGAIPINQARRTVVVIPLSSADKPRPPLTIPVKCLGRQAVAVCDQIRVVDKSRLLERIEAISKEDLLQLEKGLSQTLALWILFSRAATNSNANRRRLVPPPGVQCMSRLTPGRRSSVSVTIPSPLSSVCR